MMEDRKLPQFFSLARREPRPIEGVLRDFVKLSGLDSGINGHRVDVAWDEASGVAAWTVARSFVDGTYIVTLASSVVRNQLSFRKQDIIRTMNGILEADPLFSKDSPGACMVKKLVLR